MYVRRSRFLALGTPLFVEQSSVENRRHRHRGGGVHEARQPAISIYRVQLAHQPPGSRVPSTLATQVGATTLSSDSVCSEANVNIVCRRVICCVQVSLSHSRHQPVVLDNTTQVGLNPTMKFNRYK